MGILEKELPYTDSLYLKREISVMMQLNLKNVQIGETDRVLCFLKHLQ